VILFLDELQSPLHVNKPGGSDSVFLLHFCPANPQQSRDSFGLNATVKDRRNVVKTEAELPQRNDSMQTLKLRRIIGPVTTELVHVGWHQQTRSVPMPQHPMGYLPDLRESSNG